MKKRSLSAMLVFCMLMSLTAMFAVNTMAAGTGTSITPYQMSSGMTLYEGDVNKSFSMMGISYINGIVADHYYDQEMLFNLGASYQLKVILTMLGTALWR